MCSELLFFFFFFNDPAPPEFYPLSLHDALPIPVSGALANEWAVTAASARAPTGIFGPVRYGSQWIIAAYAPIEAPQAKAAAASPAWAVGYQSLDALLVRAGFGRVVKDGFAFQINQTDPLTHGVRELFGRSEERRVGEEC